MVDLPPSAVRSATSDQSRPAPDPASARRNRLLAGLSDGDLDALLAESVTAPLPLGTVLHEPGQPVHRVHFPLSGVISLVTDLGSQVVEVATIGNEGMAGVSVFLGAGAPSERASVQVAGEAVVLDATVFLRVSAGIDGPLYAAMRRYTQILFTQLARNAACNRVHSVQQRAARWLLTTDDRMESPTFGLTQHFLAQMLAVRRASVSTIARTLAADGCLRYTRGTITILDRARLEGYTCSCYQVVRETTDRGLSGPPPLHG